MSKNIIIRKRETKTTAGDETTVGDETGDDKAEWLAFMAHIPHSEVETIEQELQEYKYIIGLETSEYEHYHFYVKMTEKQYYNFAMRIFRNKYQLRGRATKGCPRQYGKEKNIKDHEKMARYTCKDKNVRSNMTKEEIDEVLGMKLEEVKNTKKKSKYEKMIAFVEKDLNRLWDTRDNMGTREIKISIIDFMRDEKMILRKTTIDSYYYYFRTETQYQDWKSTSTSIYETLYNDHQREYNYA
ncbi:MAG: putative replicase [Cressdnaviricota sp.]|nr:MAG: putative replicase [Cressdnaviricota sp.]